MKKSSNSIDGFLPRRGGEQRELDVFEHRKLPKPIEPPKQEVHHALRKHDSKESGISGLTRSDLDESLRSIEDEAPDVAKPSGKVKKPQSRRRKIIKRVLIALAVILLCVGAWLGIRALIMAGSVFQGNAFGLLQSQPLKEDANGRSNILIFGTSEDDPGHEGALLTDSIMLLSLDQTRKNAVMVSIPRDLWVDFGTACTAGYQGKINEVYNCGSNGGQKEAAGANALKKKVGEIFGLDVQYYAHLNYGVIKDSVDAVDGVKVKIESDDPRGIYDPNFDWQCKHQCNMVKYANGTVSLDGEHALALARARGAAGGYGLGGGNFDREGYQQKILIALKDKATSTGTITNVAKVSSLIDAFGKNLRTNFATKEIRTLMSLGENIPNEKIKRLSLVDEKEPMVTTGNYGGASIVRPVAGLMDYTQIQSFIAKNTSRNAIVREGAVVDIMNGSGVVGAAQVKADELKAKKYTIGVIGNVPSGSYAPVEIYMLSKDKTSTKKNLEKMYGVSVKTSQPPIASQADFVIIVGTDTRTPSNR